MPSHERIVAELMRRELGITSMEASESLSTVRIGAGIV